MTVRVRLTLWYSALLVLLVVAFAAASYAYLKRVELNRIDSTLHEQSEIVTQAMLSFGGTRVSVDSLDQPRVLGAIHDLRARGIRAWIFDESGKLVLSTAQVQEGEGPGEEREVLGDTLSSSLLSRDAADRLTHTVNDIFLLARVDAQQVPTTSAPLYLADVVTAACRAMRSIADRRGISIECVADVDAPYVGDEQLPAADSGSRSLGGSPSCMAGLSS